MTELAQPQQQEEHISVCVRVRPLNSRELRDKHTEAVTAIPSQQSLTLANTLHSTYDQVFGASASTPTIYHHCAQSIVRSCLRGINGTIFAYGQTSSGKTFTMHGSDDDSNGGILGLAVAEVFGFIAQSPEVDFLLRVSFVEIYNEVIYDLLGGKREEVKLREDPKKGVFVDCQEQIITKEVEVWECLRRGERHRTVGHTQMNERSSRSHSIFKIVIESKRKKKKQQPEQVKPTNNNNNRQSTEEELDGAVLVASLSLVDLAGSESVRYTGAEGIRKREAGNINCSLLTLSRVINMLAAKSTDAVNPSASQMAAVPPFRDKTKSTLHFAQSAKSITNQKATVNEILDDQAQLKKLKKEVHELKKIIKSTTMDDNIQTLKAENKALLEEKLRKEEKMQRLMGLILTSGSNCIDDATRNSTDSEKVMSLGSKKKSKRKNRETWGPGDFLIKKNNFTNPKKNYSSPNPAPRKKQVFQFNDVENIPPCSDAEVKKTKVAINFEDDSLHEEIASMKLEVQEKNEVIRLLQKKIEKFETNLPVIPENEEGKESPSLVDVQELKDQIALLQEENNDKAAIAQKKIEMLTMENQFLMDTLDEEAVEKNDGINNNQSGVKTEEKENVKLLEMEEMLEKMDSDLSEAMKEVNVYRDENSELKEFLRDTMNENEARVLELENQMLRMKAEEEERTIEAEMHANLQLQVEKYEEQIKNHHELQQNWLLEKEDLVNQLKDKIEVEGKTDTDMHANFEAQVEKYEEQIKNHHELQKNWHLEKEDLVNQLKDMEMMLEIHKENMLKERLKMSSEVDSTYSANEKQRSKEAVSHQQNIDALHMQLKDMEQVHEMQKENWQHEKSKLQKEILLLKDGEIDNNKTVQNASFQKELDAMKEKLEESESEQSLWKQKLLQQKDLIEEENYMLTDEIGHLKAEISTLSSLNNETGALKSQIESLIAENENLKQHNDEKDGYLIKEIESLKAEIAENDGVIQENVNLKQKLNETASKIAEYEANVNNANVATEETIDTLKKQFQLQIEDLVAEHETEIQSLQTKLLNFESKIAMKDEIVQDESQEYNDDVLTLKSKEETYQREIGMMKKLLQKMEFEHESSKQQIIQEKELIDEENRTLNDEISRMKLELSQMRSMGAELETFKNQNDSNKADSKHFEDDDFMHKHEISVQNKACENEVLKQKLSESLIEVEVYERKLTEITAQLAEQKEQYEVCNSEYQRRVDTLDKANLELRELNQNVKFSHDKEMEKQLEQKKQVEEFYRLQLQEVEGKLSNHIQQAAKQNEHYQEMVNGLNTQDEVNKIEFQTALQQKNEDLQNVHTRLQSAETALNEMTKRCEKIQSDNNEDKYQQELKAMKEKLEENESEQSLWKQKLLQQKDLIEEENYMLTDEIGHLKAEISTLSSLNNETGALKSQIESLIAENENLKQHNDEKDGYLIKEIESLKAEIAENDGVIQENVNLKQKLNETASKIAEYEANVNNANVATEETIDTLKKQFQQHIKDLILQHDLEKQKLDIKNTENETKLQLEIQETIEKSQNCAAQMKSQEEGYKHELSALTKELEDKETEQLVWKQKVIQQKELIEEENYMLTDEISHLKEDISQLRSSTEEQEDLKKQIGALIIENKSLKQQNIENNEQMMNEILNLQTKLSENDGVIQENTKLKRKLTQDSTKVEESESKLTIIHAQLSEAINQNDTLSEEVAYLKERLLQNSELKEELEYLKQKQKQTYSVIEENEYLKQKYQELKDEKDDLEQGKLAQLLLDKEAAELEKADVLQQLEEMKLKLETQKQNDGDVSNYQHRMEIEELTEAVQAAENEAMRYRQKTQEQQKRIDYLNSVKITKGMLDRLAQDKKKDLQIRQLLSERKNKQKLVDEEGNNSVEQISNLQASTSRLENMLLNEQKEKERLENEVLRVQQKQKECQDALELKTQEWQKEKQKANQLQEFQLQELTQKLEQLQQQLETAQKQADKQQNTITYLEKENLDLHMELNTTSGTKKEATISVQNDISDEETKGEGENAVGPESPFAKEENQKIEEDEEGSGECNQQ